VAKTAASAKTVKTLHAAALAPAMRPHKAIADIRERFAKKGPPTAEDAARARAFIDGKIEMVRGDRTLTAAEKASAIAELEAKR
jgi:hypothetical protein